VRVDVRLLPARGPVRRDLALAIGLGIASAIFVVAQAGLLSRALDGVFLRGRGLGDLRPLLVGLVAVALVRALAVYGAEVVAQRSAAETKRALRVRLARRLVDRGPVWTTNERAGELAHTLVGGVDALDAYVSQYLPHAALAVLTPVLVLVAVLVADPLSALVLAITYPLVPVFMILIGTRAAARTRRQWLELSRLGAAFLDQLAGLPTLKVFGRAEAAADTLEASGRKLRDVTMSVLRVAFLSALALELVAMLGTALVAVEIGLRLVYGRIEFSSGLFVLLLTPEFYRPLRALGAAYHAGMAGTEAGQRVFDVLEGEAATRVADPGVTVVGARAPGPPAITLEGVRAAYGPGLPPALDAVSFALAPGETLALVGPSGSGKTTVANLLLRFLEPHAGRITVDGEALDGKDPDAWRDGVAWVPQRPHLFYGTVLENLRLGRPDATREEIEEAARQAEALAFIEELPLRFDTPVGEGGLRLSGGEAQRLALARAFLKDAPFLVLDEPTAQLDPETEDRLARALRRLCAGRTVLLIAHRRRTVAEADRAVRLHAGRVVEQGAPGVLLARGRPFAPDEAGR
jgi:ATP-binding cassette subfamily C protein CydD